MKKFRTTTFLLITVKQQIVVIFILIFSQSAKKENKSQLIYEEIIKHGFKKISIAEGKTHLPYNLYAF